MNRLSAVLAMCIAIGPARAERILWFSPANAVNLTSADPPTPMDGGFRFELGVFEGLFTPTPQNKDQWAQHWRPAARTAYDAGAKAFNDAYDVEDNTAPFTVGKPAYVWGFRGDPASGEWILFRASSWTWPVVNPLNPEPPSWNAAAATAVIGEIKPSGSPFLMQCAEVSQAAPPPTTWAQWQAEELEGELQDQPEDDPDRDGMANLIEFVFGTPPKQAGMPVITPVTIAEHGGLPYLQMSVPRRVDHPATLVVEVTGDLLTWNSGSLHTEVVSDTLEALVVRDKVPFQAPMGGRFMRLRVTVED
jgi:hypothetical protein